MRRILVAICATVSAIFAAGMQSTLADQAVASGKKNSSPQHKLTVVAQSPEQWTGLAVDRSSTIFVNYPRWSDNVPISVGKIGKDGKVTPFPDAEWNEWKTGTPVDNHFVCVQAIYVDKKNSLWVLDPASPKMQGALPGAPKLVQFDPQSGKLLKVYKFDSTVAPEKSYLNDVRFSKDGKYAFITDSGAGAILVVDLVSGRTRRLLSDDPSTKSEHTHVVIDGNTWMRGGKTPDIDADGIAIDANNDYLYYHALTGRTLYRIPVPALLDESLSAKELSTKVEKVADTGANDGLEFAPDGYMYITDLMAKAITRWKPGMSHPRIVVQDSQLNWPDSFAVGPGGNMYFSISQIEFGNKPPGTYKIFKFKL